MSYTPVVAFLLAMSLGAIAAPRARACRPFYREGRVPVDGDIEVPLNVRLQGFVAGVDAIYRADGSTIALVADPTFGTRPAEALLPDTGYSVRSCPSCGVTAFRTGTATDDAPPSTPVLLSVDAVLTPDSDCTASDMELVLVPSADDRLPPDRVGYNVYAGPEGAARTLRFTYWLATAAMPGEASLSMYVPDGLGSGPFEVHVTAVDAAGNESAPSAPLRVVADVSSADLAGCGCRTTPGAGARSSGFVALALLILSAIRVRIRSGTPRH